MAEAGLFTADEIYMRIKLTEMEIIHQLKERRSSNKTIETKSNYSANSNNPLLLVIPLLQTNPPRNPPTIKPLTMVPLSQN